MKALILAGGAGVRLRLLTEKTPKSLIKVGEKTILGRILDSLVSEGISKAVFLLGYRGEAIKKFVSQNYPFLESVFVFDPPDKPANSMYIYSMWYARKFLNDDDILYIHGDTFFDPVLLKRLIKFPHSGALINKSFASQKDFNARVKNGLIKEIGVKVFGEGTGFCLPVYKFLEKDFALWLKKIEEFIENNQIDCYAENALNEITDKIKFYPVYFDKEIGMEIDDFEDLKKAERLAAEI